MDNVFEAWYMCTKKLKDCLNERVFNTMIAPISPIDISGSNFIVGVPNAFLKKFIEDKYASLIEDILQSILEKPIRVVININPPPQKEAKTCIEVEKNRPEVITETNRQLKSEHLKSNLNSRYSFNNFVVGNSNRLAYAAALRVAEAPANSYNPLFIYGASGLGKTHLLQAIGNKIEASNPAMKVLYISSETFMNEIISSIYTKNTESFRRKYRNIDCLIIDDIQFLKDKKQTQLEFFHTFNTLYESNKQIVISSDQPPKEIGTLEERLRTRFESGLLADIQKPDLETRMAIIRKKAQTDDVIIPNDAIALLAGNIENNIRELEGAYNKLLAYSSLMAMPIDLETAQKVLNDMNINSKAKIVTAKTIILATSDFYNVKSSDLYGKGRKKIVAHARQTAMYLCRELANLSFREIGECLGGRDHSTALFAYEKISKSLLTDVKLKEEISQLTTRITSP